MNEEKKIIKWRCPICGEVFTNRTTEEMEKHWECVSLGKEIKPKELKGQHTDMVILNDLDDMLREMVLERKIADMRGEK